MSLDIVNSALQYPAGPIPLFDPRVDTIDEIRLASRADVAARKRPGRLKDM